MKQMKSWTVAVLAVAALALVFCEQFPASRAADNARATAPPAASSRDAGVTPGRALFLKNCAHCHGADAHGDEGPDLHQLDASDRWIANRIRSGKKGQMPAFAGKLQPSDIDALIAYLRTLK
jgi:cytochrome c oxidase cbb3-type subunit 3